MVNTKQPRGKSIIRKDGRIETRVKGRKASGATTHDDTDIDNDENEMEREEKHKKDSNRITNTVVKKKKLSQSVDNVLSKYSCLLNDLSMSV